VLNDTGVLMARRHAATKKILTKKFGAKRQILPKARIIPLDHYPRVLGDSRESNAGPLALLSWLCYALPYFVTIYTRNSVFVSCGGIRV
jgi:hypothetical protein